MVHFIYTSEGQNLTLFWVHLNTCRDAQKQQHQIVYCAAKKYQLLIYHQKLVFSNSYFSPYLSFTLRF